MAYLKCSNDVPYVEITNVSYYIDVAAIKPFLEEK